VVVRTTLSHAPEAQSALGGSVASLRSSFVGARLSTGPSDRIGAMGERADPGRPAATAEATTTTAETVVLFDGVCNLCNGTVQFLLQRDRRGQFRFAALQSSAGRNLLRRHGLPEDALETIVVLDSGRAWLRSDGALLLARRLPWPWPLLYVFRLCPRSLRDAIYSWIARNRYRWFGRRESCMLPTAEGSARFLDGGQ
jgi:predicted DCC family thiol-disulfide oxidoreductase YuxK